MAVDARQADLRGALCGGLSQDFMATIPTPRSTGHGSRALAEAVPRVFWYCVGRGAACAVNNPRAALRWGAHTELLEASVRCRWVRTLCVCTAAAVRAGESQRDLKTRCLCHLPPGPSPPPCLPRSPSPCPVAGCLTRWRCPWSSARAKSINMRLLHPRAALSSHSGARSVARRRVHIHEHVYTAWHEPDLTDQ